MSAVRGSYVNEFDRLTSAVKMMQTHRAAHEERPSHTRRILMTTWEDEALHCAIMYAARKGTIGATGEIVCHGESIPLLRRNWIDHMIDMSYQPQAPARLRSVSAAELMRRQLIQPYDGACYVLTPDGVRVARWLRSVWSE